MTGLGDLFPIEHSDLYQRCLLERKEIDRIERDESAREGYAVGRERAEWIWVTRHRNQWIRAWHSGQNQGTT